VAAGYFLVLNGVLLLLVVTSAPQRATIGVVGYVDAHREIGRITRVSEFIQVPAVFVSHQVVLRESKEVSEDALACDGVVAVLALTKTGLELAVDPRFTKVGEFQPGPLEQLLVAINPRHNARRGAVLVLRPSHCARA
jgi:hypothetical protein